MGIRQFRPVTPATRFRIISDFKEITKKPPEESLLERLIRVARENGDRQAADATDLKAARLIVPVPELLVESVAAELGFERLTLKVSSASLSVSPLTSTVTFRAVAPAYEEEPGGDPLEHIRNFLIRGGTRVHALRYDS